MEKLGSLRNFKSSQSISSSNNAISITITLPLATLSSQYVNDVNVYVTTTHVKRKEKQTNRSKKQVTNHTHSIRNDEQFWDYKSQNRNDKTHI